MPQCYHALLSNLPQGIADTSKTYQFLSERHLQAMWLEQKYFRRLQTTTGEPIVVLSPGIWNADAGPDFLKAHIKIGTREYRGDIELHLMEESWHQHGHDSDARYNDVVLHVSLWKPKQELPITTKSGRVVLQAHLEDLLTIPHARIVQLIDLDLYPYKKFIGSGRCAQALFRTLPEAEIGAFFKNAAEWRLEQKRNYLKSHVATPSHLMGAGIAMALGYKNNTETFLTLYTWLKGKHGAGEEDILAMGMQACGFFEESYREKWFDSPYYARLMALTPHLPLDDAPHCQLVLNQVRPLNHPVRRLAVLAKLLADPDLTVLFAKMETCWNNGWPHCKGKKDWSALLQELRGMLPAYQDAYWNCHYSFEKNPREEALSLIGDDLKNGIIVNTFLPLLQEGIVERGHPKETSAFDEFYAAIPAAGSGKTKYLIHRFFGDGTKGALLKKAVSEQGAYQLHRDFCIHYEASCFGCPFIERYKDALAFRGN